MQTSELASAFLHLYNLIGEDGKKERLFGNPDQELLEECLLTGIPFSEHPSCYFEFPLQGPPWMDLLLLHGTGGKPLLPSAKDAPYYATFQAAAQVHKENFAYGLEWDLSRGNPAREPGFYIDHANDSCLVETALGGLGLSDRFGALKEFFLQLPSGWERYYIGLFPNREGSPLRLGLLIGGEHIQYYKKHPSSLQKDLKALGYENFDQTMEKELLNPVYEPFDWDLQLDLYPDGSIGPDLGLSYYLAKNSKAKSYAFFQSQSIQQFFYHLQEKQLVDERWHLLPECLISRRTCTFSEGRIVRLGLKNDFNFLKVKWRDGKPQPAKFYFVSKVWEL